MTPPNPNTRLCVFPDLFKQVVVRSFYDRAMASRNSGRNGTDGRSTNHETLLRRLQQVGNLLVVYLTRHNRQKGSAQGEKRSVVHLLYELAHQLAISIRTRRSIPPERNNGIDIAAASPRCFFLPE